MSDLDDRLEDTDLWPKLLEVKDSLSIREMAREFATTPGKVAAAFRRTGIGRTGARPGRKPKLGGLPPEKRSSAPKAKPTRQPAPVAVSEGGVPSPRPGSKDALIIKHHHLLGKVPDAEVAKRCGVNKNTIANYRQHYGIPGFDPHGRTTPHAAAPTTAPASDEDGLGGPRSKIEPWLEHLGKVPDSVVAKEAGVTINAVRNYRARHGIPAAPKESWNIRELDAAPPEPAEPPAPVAAPAVVVGQSAWKVTFGDGAEGIVVADSLVAAATRAQARGAVRVIEHVGAVF